MARGAPFATMRRTARALHPHAAGQGSGLVAGALLGALTVGLLVARPWPLKWILDGLSGTNDGVLGRVAPSPATAMLILALLYVAISVAGAAAEYAQTLLLSGIGNRVLYRFRASLFGHLLAQPLAFHESRETGELLTRVVYDSSRLRRGVNGLLVQVVQTVVLTVATVAVLLWHDRWLGLALGVGVLLTVAAMRRPGRRIARAARQQRRKEGTLAALVDRELRSVRELHAYGTAGSVVQRRFAARNERSLAQEQKVRRLAAGLVLRADVLLAATVAVALALGVGAVLEGRLTPGDVVLLVSYAAALRAPLLEFARQTGRAGRTAACAERLLRIVERAPETADETDAVEAPPLAGELLFDGVSTKASKRVRGARKWTLDDVHLRIPAGARVGIVGTNGAGKSTLLRLIPRLAEPDRGRILLDGRDLRSLTRESVRRQVSVVFQGSVLTGLTVREHIALGRPGASEEEVRAAAERARVHDLVAALPRGYETRLRRNGDLFSGGERQRLAIARALLRDGRLWLLDEPTTGLDGESAAELTELLLELTSGRTTLWVTHDPVLLERVDLLVALDQGRVTFVGEPAIYQAGRPPRGDQPLLRES